ncbi:hypothetical protein SAMN04488024_101476 [Pedobacter soli]|uniref:Uncharacterized protein n=1 Tax=Pedobacter soli TaxID=390242 RepID=A0A1G6JJR9_9SPHI|nr:hypothetical protein SAMN04488024_101476 [Pedobacter soli]
MLVCNYVQARNNLKHILNNTINQTNGNNLSQEDITPYSDHEIFMLNIFNHLHLLQFTAGIGGHGPTPRKK